MRLVSTLLVLFCVSSTALAASPEVTHSCIEASTKGQTDRDEGRLIAAREHFLVCARDACPSIVRKSCATWLNELTPRVPSVVVRVHEADQRDVTDARVAIDGEPIALDGRPVALDPGAHTLRIESAQHSIERTLLLVEREQARLITVELPATPPPAVAPEPVRQEPPQHQTPFAPRRPYSIHPAAWVIGGIGVAELAVFAALRINARRELDRLEVECAPTCRPEESEAGNRKTLTADISLGIGIAALTGAAAWGLGGWLLHRREDHAQLAVTPLRDGAFATFVSRY